jgi:hypothetical protein
MTLPMNAARHVPKQQNEIIGLKNSESVESLDIGKQTSS